LTGPKPFKTNVTKELSRRIGRRLRGRQQRLPAIRKVIDPKYDTCTKQGARRVRKNILVPDVHRQMARAKCCRINAKRIIGSPSRHQFISVMLRR
jgi:hypothetical protein